MTFVYSTSDCSLYLQILLYKYKLQLLVENNLALHKSPTLSLDILQISYAACLKYKCLYALCAEIDIFHENPCWKFSMSIFSFQLCWVSWITWGIYFCKIIYSMIVILLPLWGLLLSKHCFCNRNLFWGKQNPMTRCQKLVNISKRKKSLKFLKTFCT